MLTFRTKIKEGEVLSDLGRSEAHQVGCCTALGVGSALEELESRPGFKVVWFASYILPSFLPLRVLVSPDVCVCPFVTPGKHQWAGKEWFP